MESQNLALFDHRGTSSKITYKFKDLIKRQPDVKGQVSMNYRLKYANNDLRSQVDLE